MRLPDPVAYQVALQHPATAFSDQELRQATATTNAMGLPRVAAGNFALTYQLVRSGRSWAVRCFHRDAADRARRYEAISRTLASIHAASLVTIAYLPMGVRVEQNWYPVTKMPWVDGRPLNRAVEEALTSPAGLSALEQRVIALVAELRRLGVAHGDLQHGNVLVDRSGRLSLVDYDGMFVPALKGLGASESGDPNYQHPRRKDQFDAELDRFSALVIVVALRALAAVPDLWKHYNTDDNLLFRRSDFASPGTSALFRDLSAYPVTRELADRLAEVCQSDYTQVPLLSDFLRPKLQVNPLERLADVVTLNRLYSGAKPRVPKRTRRSPRSWRVRRMVAQEALAFTRDGTRLVTAEATGRLRLRDPHTGRVTGVWSAATCVSAIAWSHDGRELAATGPDRQLFVWRVGGDIAQHSTLAAGEQRVIAFPKSGPVVAVADGRMLTLHQPMRGQCVVLKGMRTEVSCMAFSSDGKVLATGGADGSLRCWSTERGAVLASGREASIVTSVAVSPNGALLASAVDDGVRLWHIAGGVRPICLPNSASLHAPVQRLAFDATGTQLAAATDGRLIVWNVAAAELLHDLSVPAGPLSGLAFTPDGRSLAATSLNGTVWLRRLPAAPGRLSKPKRAAQAPHRPNLIVALLRKVSAAALAL